MLTIIFIIVLCYAVAPICKAIDQRFFRCYACNGYVGTSCKCEKPKFDN